MSLALNIRLVSNVRIFCHFNTVLYRQAEIYNFLKTVSRLRAVLVQFDHTNFSHRNHSVYHCLDDECGWQ